MIFFLYMIFFIETANLRFFKKFEIDWAGRRDYEFSRENSDLTRDGGQ